MTKGAKVAYFLLVPTILALLAANSPFSGHYHSFIHAKILAGFSLHDFVNEGLMAIFFLLMGLEIKYEFSEGSLSVPKQAALPLIGALGGCVAPALIYLAFNLSTSARSGWAIPMATDIAFAVGILSLFDRTIPKSLKSFLMALAVVDDLIAVAVIALFYGGSISSFWLGLSVAVFLIIAALKYFKIRNVGVYILCGFVSWFFVLKSGVHSTVAGVILGFMTPIEFSGVNGSPLKTIAKKLEPFVEYWVMPLFAFFNAGVDLSGVKSFAAFLHPVSLGVFLGLWVGKPLGVVLFSYLATRLKIAHKIPGITWAQFAVLGFFAGIGFTMSLFIQSLSFQDEELRNLSKMAFFMGSLLSGVSGVLYLKRVFKRA